MTRLEEIPWVESLSPNTSTTLIHRLPGLPGRVNIYHIPWLKPLFESRWPQFIIRILTLSGFLFTIAGALFGSLVGSHNFAIIFVWIAWWTALKLAFIPIGGRSWCSICPIPLPGEWLQQGGILEPGKKKFGLNLRWPKRLRGTWMQSGSFLLIGLFSALTLTNPRVTGWVLLAIFVLAAGLSLIFERRPFCTYMCPIGGFSGMYAQTSPVEIRMIDKEVCARHEIKSCYHACPWGVYPVAFQNNTACGQCMECLRACPHDNLAINLRPFGTDLGREKTSTRLDETLLALVMLGSVLTFTAVFIGPWGWLKTAAFEVGSTAWFSYSAGYLAFNLFLLPGIFLGAVWTGQMYSKAKVPFKRAVANQAQALIPLGLMAWIAFTVSFALPKLNYILIVMNDPFGWGWHLLGIPAAPAAPDLTAFSAVIQLVLLLVGLYWSVRVSRKLAAENHAPAQGLNLPVLGFYLAFSLVMLWLLLG